MRITPAVKEALAETPSFGSLVWAVQLGFFWSTVHLGFVRIVPLDRNRIRVDLAPWTGVQHGVIGYKRTANYIDWSRTPFILECVVDLRYKSPIKELSSFVVDENGKTVPSKELNGTELADLCVNETVVPPSNQ